LPKASKDDKGSKTIGVKTAKNGILYVVGQVVGSFSILVLLALLARLLKPSNFGLYAIVIAFYTLLGIIGNFGIGTALRKKLAETNDKTRRSTLISNSYFIAMAASLIIAIAGVLLSSTIATYVYHDSSLAGALQLASVLVIFWVFFNLTIAVLVGLEKVKEATIIDLFYSVVQPIAAVGLVVLGYGILGAVSGIAISIVLGSALGLFYLSKEIENRIIKPTKKIIKELMAFSTPIATSNIALLGPQNFAILLLGVYATSAIVGNYNAAYEIGNFVGIIFSSSTQHVLKGKHKVKDEQHVQRQHLLYTFVSSAASCICGRGSPASYVPVLLRTL
jgi:O-antigen/teichoic acid export membrane protein